MSSELLSCGGDVLLEKFIVLLVRCQIVLLVRCQIVLVGGVVLQGRCVIVHWLRCLFYGEMSDCPIGGGGVHCPLVEMSDCAQESACMRTPWRLQPMLS